MIQNLSFEVVWLGRSTRDCFTEFCAAVLISLCSCFGTCRGCFRLLLGAVLICYVVADFWYFWLYVYVDYEAYVYALGCIVVWFPDRLCSAFAIGLSYII